jgi:ASC-1-like (ASCH) protein
MSATSAIAIRYYHHLLQEQLSDSESQLSVLIHRQHEWGLAMGDRALTYSLRPSFIPEGQYIRMQDAVYLIRQAILHIANTFFHDTESMKDLALSEWEMEMAAMYTKMIRFSAVARLDAIMTDTTFKFIRVNGESPFGAAYTHHLAKLYRELSLFKQFTKTYPVRFVSPLEHLVAGLLRIYHEEFDGEQEKPSFVIVGSESDPSFSEYLLIKAYLDQFDYPCEICAPEALCCQEGWIYAHGLRCDILYRRFTMHEYQQRFEACGPYHEGYIAQKTCYVNTFKANVIHKRSLLAYLTDSRYSRILNTFQIQAIREHIPWTRFFRPQQTNYQGRMVDLVDFVRSHRSDFVLKPNDDTEGKSIISGLHQSESRWDAAIEEALANDYIVQERVDLYEEPYMSWENRQWTEIPTVVNVDPYINGPLMGGCMTRTTPVTTTSLAVGASFLPTFILRDMH